MNRPQKSTIVKTFTSHNCNRFRTSVSRAQEPPVKNPVKTELEIEEDKYFYPDTETAKTHEFCTPIIVFNIKIKGFSDLTGAYPHNSSRENLYAMVMYAQLTSTPPCYQPSIKITSRLPHLK